MSHDLEVDYETVEEFVHAMMTLQNDCDAFEKPKEVDIPLSESDLQELMDGEHFHWGYAGGVHLFLGDDSEDDI